VVNILYAGGQPTSHTYLFPEVSSAPYGLHWPVTRTTMSYASSMGITEVLGKPFQPFAIGGKVIESKLTTWFLAIIALPQKHLQPQRASGK
jgi:hypothetical protein